MKRFTSIIAVLVLGSCSHSLSPEEQREYEDRVSKTEIAVTNWIKKNAKYPESYDPGLFSEYSESATLRHDEKVPDSENYSIKHIHRMLDKDSNLTSFSGYFILEHDYFVSMIESVRSSAVGGAFPPKTEIWRERFGRLLNANDSIELENRQQQENRELIIKLKNGLNSGDMYPEDPDARSIIMNIIDTLESKNKN